MRHDIIQLHLSRLKAADGIDPQYALIDAVKALLKDKKEESDQKPELTKPEMLVQKLKERPTLLHIATSNAALVYLLEAKVAEEKARVKVVEPILSLSLNERTVILYALNFYLQKDVLAIEKRAIAENLVKRLNQ